jgi:hypothetical protein
MMAAVIELPGKTVNLDEVEGLSEEHYQGLLAYALQWDSPQQEDWAAQIREARGEVVATEPEGYAALNVDELQDALRARDLPVSGNKAELVARLEEDDAS